MKNNTLIPANVDRNTALVLGSICLVAVVGETFCEMISVAAKNWNNTNFTFDLKNLKFDFTASKG